MAHAKSNIDQLGRSLEYAIDDGSFRWIGETDLTANDLQMQEQTGEKRKVIDEAVQLLHGALSGGARPCREVQTELRDAGITEATLRRAKSKLGVSAVKTDMRGGWVWSLQEDAHP
jgi:hypothetical protein